MIAVNVLPGIHSYERKTHKLLAFDFRSGLSSIFFSLLLNAYLPPRPEHHSRFFSIILFAREKSRVGKIPLPSYARTYSPSNTCLHSLEEDNQPYEMKRHVFASNVWGSIATEYNEPQKNQRGARCWENLLSFAPRNGCGVCMCVRSTDKYGLMVLSLLNPAYASDSL